MTAGLAVSQTVQRAALIGAGLTLLNTLVSVSTDAIAKDLVSSYPAPQLMLLSGGLAILAGLLAMLFGQRERILRTGTPRLVALRSALGAASTAGFFYALRDLPFAQVFLFIAIMPILAAVLSGLVLRERIGRGIWAALALGLAGMMFLFPEGRAALCWGHAYGLAASVAGSASIVLSRRICRSHTHSMAQVFYAQLACFATGLVIAPFVWLPMETGDLGLLALYTAFLIGTRWLMVVILRMLPAYAVMQITNVQFIWMVFVGHSVFGETTGAHLWMGAALVIGSGLWLVRAQQRG